MPNSKPNLARAIAGDLQLWIPVAVLLAGVAILVAVK